MVAIYNFPPLRRGDTFTGASFTMQVGGVPMNLAGAQVKIEVRPKKNPATLSWSWSTQTNTITITNTNQINLLPRNGIIMNFEPGTYLYDLQITFPDGTIKTYLEGIIPIEDDVTK